MSLMNIQEYLEKIKSLKNEIIYYLGHNVNIEEYYQNLVSLFDNQGIENNNYDLKLLLKLLIKISNNHYRAPNFFSKIEKIILHFKKEIKQNFSNYEIFDIFKSNKRILLFLFEEKIIFLDNRLFEIITNQQFSEMKYPEYFSPEINQYITEHQLNQNKDDKIQSLIKKTSFNLTSNFEEKRKAGENDSIICKLIQKDSIDDFISYVNKENYLLNSRIELSKFETNSFLIKQINKSIDKPSNNYYYHNKNSKENKGIQLIEYAAFFGAIQIIRYLISNNVELTPKLWIYAIHSDNPELINLMEENKIAFTDTSYDDLINESIKCHHNDIVNYIQSNYLQENEINNEIIIIKALKYCNFDLIQPEFINQSCFHYLCKYDYYYFVYFLLKNGNINVNQIGIVIRFFILFLIM